MNNALDQFSWDYNSLDDLIDDLFELPILDKRFVITRYGLMRMLNFEIMNFVIPTLIGFHIMSGISSVVYLGLKGNNEKYIAGFFLHFICSSLWLCLANFMYSSEELRRNENRWGKIFALMIVWKVSVDYSAAWLIGPQGYYRELLNLGFIYLFIQDYLDDVDNRLKYLFNRLPQQIEVLVLPYQLIDSPWILAVYIKWIDHFMLNYVMALKSPTLTIEYDGSHQLGAELHDAVVYWSLIHDIHQLHPSIHLNLKYNHLFDELSYSRIDSFFECIPYDKRQQIDLSENGESDYQRAFGPVLQMARQYDLNENVGKEILSYLPR